MNQNYASNSHKSKQESNNTKNIKPVVKGHVTAKKPSTGKKFKDSLIAEDMSSVGNYIFFDVFMPSLKDTISSIISNGVDMMLYGDGGRVRHSSSSSRSNYTSYSSLYSKDPRNKVKSVRGSERYEYDDIVFDNMGEARDVISHLQDILEEYGMVSVADLYDLVGMQTNYTDNKYGWYDLAGINVSRVRDGYLLKLPKIIVLD